MLLPKSNAVQGQLFFSLQDMLDAQHPLYILANQIDWQKFEDAFSPLYSATQGAPAKPIRLMVGLLMLKHIRNVSDESVVEQWSENNYYQYFCGNNHFVCSPPCEASELVHFRKRIGETGVELILAESIRMNGDDSYDKHVSIDTTVQEKNITFPTDSKLHKKIIAKCLKIAEAEQLPLRQSYSRTIKKLSVDQRFRNHPKNKGKAKKADKKIKTIAGRLVRELERNLPPASYYQTALNLFKQVLSQTKTSKQKIYSLHEPDVQCIAKGKENKKYEFGNKASFAYTQTTGVIVAAKSFRNEYDGHTTAETLAQRNRLLGEIAAEIAIGDRGYRGIKQVGETLIETPKPFAKSLTKYQQQQQRKRFKRRAAIEPMIGHLKTDHRLSRNFYKGIVGDNINVMLSAAAFNFKRMMNKWKSSFLSLLKNMFESIYYELNKKTLKYLVPKMAF